MPTFSKPSIIVKETDPTDPRIGTLLGRKVQQPSDARVVLLGFPSDEGVRLNGGRVGASLAPDTIRHILYALTPDTRHYEAFVDVVEHTLDLGNLALKTKLEFNQEQLGEVLADLLKRGAIPIILGGGHETTFGHFLGYVYSGQSVSVINFDAHPDVRPLINDRGHSGSPFRQMLVHLSGSCIGYTVVGLSPHNAAKLHLEYIAANYGRYVWNQDLKPEHIDHIVSQTGTPCLASFDIDAVDQVYAPGVSAPAAAGMSQSTWLHAAFVAGHSPNVSSLDLVELNPHFDIDNRTARLAALTVWKMLEGLALRFHEE